MKLLETKGKYNYGDANVELTVELDDGSLIYIHLAEIDGVKHFTASKTSIYAYMTDASMSADSFNVPKFDEDFDSLEGAGGSVYKKYYEAALRVFEELGE